MRKNKRINVNKEDCNTDILVVQKYNQVFAIQTFV